MAGNFDFNGDGNLDILIGAEEVNRTQDDDPVAGCNAGAPCGPGKVYLIYFDPTDTTNYPNIGDPTTPDVVDLADVGGAIPGVVFDGTTLGDQVGFAVAGGGSANAGTGHDILIGAPGRSVNGKAGAGAAYLIFDDATLSGTVGLNRVANGLQEHGFEAGDAVALYMPMNMECVAAYLGIVRSGCRVVSIADSFSPVELAKRFELGKAKGIITSESYLRGGRKVDLFAKVKQAETQRAPEC